MGYKEDVIIVAKALVEDSIYYMDGDYNCGYCCKYCDNDYQGDWENFKHDIHCPVLVAKDLLTNMET